MRGSIASAAHHPATNPSHPPPAPLVHGSSTTQYPYSTTGHPFPAPPAAARDEYHNSHSWCYPPNDDLPRSHPTDQPWGPSRHHTTTTTSSIHHPYPHCARSNELPIQAYFSSSSLSAPQALPRESPPEIFFPSFSTCSHQYPTTVHRSDIHYESSSRYSGHLHHDHHHLHHPQNPSSRPNRHHDRHPHDPQPPHPQYNQQHGIVESRHHTHLNPQRLSSCATRRQHHPYGTPPALPQPQPPLVAAELLPLPAPGGLGLPTHTQASVQEAVCPMDPNQKSPRPSAAVIGSHIGALPLHGNPPLDIDISQPPPSSAGPPIHHQQQQQQQQPHQLPQQHLEPQQPLTYCNLYVSKVPRSMSDAVLLSHFAPYGATSATIMRDSRNGDSKGFGFVVFPDEASGREGHAAVMRSATGRAFDVFPSRHVQQQAPLAAADRCPSLYIRNIPVAIASEAVAALLGRFGRVLRLALRKDPAGLAVWLCFATFSAVSEADSALVALHNQFRFPGATLPVVVKYDRHQGTFQPASAIGSIGGGGSPSQATAAAKRKKEKTKDPPGADAEACVASTNTNTDPTTAAAATAATGAAAHRRDQQRLRRAVRRARKREQRRLEELNPDSGANPDDDEEDVGDDRDDHPNGGDEGSQDAASLAVFGACEQQQLTPLFPPQAPPQHQHASSDAIPPPCNASIVAAPPMATGAGPATATTTPVAVVVAPPVSVPQPQPLALPIFEPLPGASSSSSSSNHHVTATTAKAIVSATTDHSFNRHPHNTQACGGAHDDANQKDLTNSSARRSLLIGGKSIPRPPPVVVQTHPKEPQQLCDSGSSPTGRHEETPAAFGPATTTTAPSPAAGRRFDGSGSYFDGGYDTGGGSPTGGPTDGCFFSFDVEPPAAPPYHHQDPYYPHRHFSAESAEGILHQRHDSHDMNTSTSYHQQQQQQQQQDSQPAIGFVFDRRRLSLSGYGGGASTTTIGGAAVGLPGVGGLGRSGVVIRSRASSYSRLVHSAASGPMSAGPSPTSPNPPLPSPLLPATGTAAGAHLDSLTSPNWTACQKGDAQSPPVAAAAAAAHSAYHYGHAIQKGGSTTVSPGLNGLNGTVGSGSGVFAAGGGLLSVPTQANTAGGALGGSTTTTSHLLTPMSLPVAVERPAPDSGLWYRSSPYAGGFEHLFHRGGGSPSASMSSASGTNHGSHSATTLQHNHNTAGSRHAPNATPNNDNNANVSTHAGTSISHRPLTSTACGAPRAAPAETPHESDKARHSASVTPSNAVSAGTPAGAGAGMRVVATVGSILPPSTSNTTPLVEVIATPTVHALLTYERAAGGEGQQGRGDFHLQPSPFI